MAEFTGDIAGMLELMAIAGGLVLLHFAAKSAGSKLLSAAGWLLVVGGVLMGACTMYYWVTYQMQGGFDTAHPHMYQRGYGYHHMGYPDDMMPRGMMYDDDWSDMRDRYHDRMMRGDGRYHMMPDSMYRRGMAMPEQTDQGGSDSN